MPPSSATQRSSIAKFVDVTNVTDKKTAERYLKAHNWNVDNAVNEYFTGGAATKQSSATKKNLNALFDNLRDAEEAKEYPDALAVGGSIAYVNKLGFQETELAMLVVSEVVRSPSIGEIPREGFISGWDLFGADTLDKQKRRMAQIMTQLPSDRVTFTRVYKHTFPLGKAAGAKVLKLDDAIEFWTLLFSSPDSPVRWSTPSTPWLEWWTVFLKEKWKKDVNKDLWEQTLKFAEKCLEDESMSWWSEDSAWPGVIDEFVEWVQEKRPKPDEDVEDMDIE